MSSQRQKQDKGLNLNPAPHHSRGYQQQHRLKGRGDSHLGGRLTQLCTQSHVFKCLAGLRFAQTEAGEKR